VGASGTGTARSPLTAWVVQRLVSFRTGAALDINAMAKETKISPAGIRKMESLEESNPTIENLYLYTKACGKTLGEFFEPLIPPENPRYDRYMHRVVQAALEHPTAKTYVRNLIGLLNEVMQ